MISLTTNKILTAIMVLFICSTAFPQKYKPRTRCYAGGGIESFSSGNWHGAFFSTYFNLTKGRNSFSAGPVIQRRSGEFSGAKFAYSYNLSGARKNKNSKSFDEDEQPEPEDYVMREKPPLLQLNVFGYSQYINNTLLSRDAYVTEQKAANEVSTDWSSVRLSTAEAGLGFELYVRITKRVSWKNYIAGAVYYHTKYINGMYHERTSPVLMLGTGIHVCPL